MNFQQLLLILRARWWVVLGAVALVGAGSLIVSLMLPKQYTASASIVVDIKPDPLMGALLPTQMTSGYMATQVDIIKSDRVAQLAVKTLKLDQSSQLVAQWRESTGGRGTFEAWLGARFSKKLDVKPSRESNVITVSFNWEDPKGAAALANAFAQAYIDTALELKVEPARQYAAWFDKRNKALKETVEQSQKKLSDYQRAKGIVALDERLDIENARLNEMSTQLVGIQSLRSDSQSRQRQVVTSKDTMPEVMNNPVVVGLSNDVARMEARRVETASRLGSSHPEIQRIEKELAALRETRAKEVNNVTSSIGANNQVNMHREADIHNALETQKQKVLQIKKQRDELAVLQNDVQSAQRNYDVVTQRLAQTSLESQMQQTNIVVLTPAEEPLEASSPNVRRNVLISLVLGLLLGVGFALLLEFLDQRVRGTEDLNLLVEAPVLGVIHPVFSPRKQATGFFRLGRQMSVGLPS